MARRNQTTVLLDQAFTEICELSKFNLENSNKIAQLHRLNGKITSPDKIYLLTVPIERELSCEKQAIDFLVETQDNDKKKLPYPIIVVLENLRSAFNVGSIIRSAECFNLEKIYLTGYTAKPENEKLKKTTMGTEEYIPCLHEANTITVIDQLKALGYELIGIETSQKATSLREFQWTKPVALFLGNERFGLSCDVLKNMDQLVRIELFGQKNSLNVSVCAGISFYEMIAKCKA